MMRLCWLLFGGVLAFGQLEERYFLKAEARPLAPTMAKAILEGVCQGEVEGNSCSKCPGLEEGPWKPRILAGHFRSKDSEDAILEASSCFYPMNFSPASLPASKIEGAWRAGELVGGFDASHCIVRKFRSEREFLLCESYDHDREGSQSYNLTTVVQVSGQELGFRNLLSAPDTTANCSEEKSRLAEVQDVSLEGDTIHVRLKYGAFKRTAKVVERCSDDRVPTAERFLRPSGMKVYQLDFLFDGSRYEATPESKAVLKMMAE